MGVDRSILTCWASFQVPCLFYIQLDLKLLRRHSGGYPWECPHRRKTHLKCRCHCPVAWEPRLNKSRWGGQINTQYSPLYASWLWTQYRPPPHTPTSPPSQPWWAGSPQLQVLSTLSCFLFRCLVAEKGKLTHTLGMLYISSLYFSQFSEIGREENQEWMT